MSVTDFVNNKCTHCTAHIECHTTTNLTNNIASTKEHIADQQHPTG